MIPHLSYVSINRIRRPKVDIGRTSVQSRLTVDSKGPTQQNQLTVDISTFMLLELFYDKIFPSYGSYIQNMAILAARKLVMPALQPI